MEGNRETGGATEELNCGTGGLGAGSFNIGGLKCELNYRYQRCVAVSETLQYRELC